MLGDKIPRILFFCLIACQLFADLFRVNFWPLSAYPMYAYPRPSSEIKSFQLWAKVKDGRRIWIPVAGGAATMFVYYDKIEKGGFESLKDRVKDDLMIFLKSSRSAKLEDVEFVELVIVRLAEEKDLSEVSVETQALWSFSFDEG